MLELGLDEDGVPKLSEALDLYRTSAGQGHAGAMYNMAMCYENGLGVPKDFTKAIKLFEEAERRGCVEAKDRLNQFKEFNIVSP